MDMQQIMAWLQANPLAIVGVVVGAFLLWQRVKPTPTSSAAAKPVAENQPGRLSGYTTRELIEELQRRKTELAQLMELMGK